MLLTRGLTLVLGVGLGAAVTASAACSAPASRPTSKAVATPGLGSAAARSARPARKARAAVVSRAAPDPFAFGDYGGRSPQPMGEKTYLHGARMRIAYLRVSDPPDRVAEVYLKRFGRARQPAFRGRLPNTEGVQYVSFHPDGTRNFKTVTLIPRGGGTLILASVGDPEPLITGRPDVPHAFPLPPNAERLVGVRQAEGGEKALSASFRVPTMEPAQARAFYRAALGKRGYAVRKGPALDHFEGGGNALSVSSTRDARGGSDVTVVWVK